MLGITGGLASHPGGGVEILSVASCYRNQDKLWPDGPLGSYKEFTILAILFKCVLLVLSGTKPFSVVMFIISRCIILFCCRPPTPSPQQNVNHEVHNRLGMFAHR